jgi:hypothetical protein
VVIRSTTPIHSAAAAAAARQAVVSSKINSSTYELRDRDAVATINSGV